VRRSSHFASLSQHYLFPEIDQRKHLFLGENPHAKVISLGIGDTTHPLPKEVAEGISKSALAMSHRDGYVGYGPSLGLQHLREAIAHKVYGDRFSFDEITISDGTKPDLARFALLTGGKQKVAIQDPAYPVYLETSQIIGQEILLLPATAENNFFPDWTSLKGPHILFLCYPNNPTGVSASREQLQNIVDHAKNEGMLILFDAAYASYITDPAIPRSIFELEGAKECAIEWGSFSKSAGFSGIRLGWCLIPKELTYSTGESILSDWKRLISTTFNGASYLSQAAGLEALSSPSYHKIIEDYLENAHLLKQALAEKNIATFGGIHAPFLWADFSPLSSWEAFDHLLSKHHLLTTPGSGFGQAGEGYLRLSALGTRPDILEAIHRLKSLKI
jgi:LL-diaminopimelate aminotransferase